MGELDSIFKENIEYIFDYLKKVLGIEIRKVQELKDKLHKTIVRETDFVKKIFDEEGNEFVLHLEFQSTNDANMALRMAEYKAILQHKHGLAVHQFVVYLGATASTMETTLPEDRQITGFQIISLRDLPVSTALDSDVPEEIIMAILSDYPKADAGKVIRQIVEKLQNTAHDESRLRRVIQQLLILSRLRNLGNEIQKQIEDMPIVFDITTDKLYNQGMQQGIQQGMQEGIKEGERRGERRGEQKGKLTIAELMIREGESAEKIARFTGLSMLEIAQIKRAQGK